MVEAAGIEAGLRVSGVGLLAVIPDFQRKRRATGAHSFSEYCSFFGSLSRRQEATQPVINITQRII